MNQILTILGWLALGFSVVGTLVAPYFIGKPRNPITFWMYLLQLPLSVVTIIALLKFLGII